MRSLGLLLALMALGGCMNVSDMGEGVRYHMSDAGLLDHSDTRRTLSIRLQPDSFIFIGQGAFVPPGTVRLQVACVFRPEIGTWTPLYQPMKGEALNRILTPPAVKSERMPTSTSVTFSGANDWNCVRRPASVGPLIPPER